MKTIFSLLVAVVCMISFSVSSFAADPVDLTGKKGIVDPKDLKKDNPKPPELQKTTSYTDQQKKIKDRVDHSPKYTVPFISPRGAYGQAK